MQASRERTKSAAGISDPLVMGLCEHVLVDRPCFYLVRELGNDTHTCVFVGYPLLLATEPDKRPDLVDGVICVASSLCPIVLVDIPLLSV